MKNKDMKVAIVHDWLVGGGAERVVEELHKMYPEAPIYTSYCTDEWRRRLDGKVVTGWLQHFGRLRKFMTLGRIWWFTHLDLSGYDLVISSSGNGEAKGIKTNASTVHVCYCHSPVHYYWRHYDQYMKRPGFGLFDPLARLGLRLLVGPLRRWDLKAAKRPDYYLANSSHIKADIKKYYGRDSVVIHPPVDVQRFQKVAFQGDKPARAAAAQGANEDRKGAVHDGTATADRSSQRRDVAVSVSGVSGSAGKQADAARRFGFITVGRQTGYKHTDIIVQACVQLGLPLTVMGSGPEHARLVGLSGPSIKFVIGASDTEVARRLAGAQAFLFAAHEDFGVTPVEAMAAGTPVIAYKAGGALDYIVPGKTGLFFDSQSVGSLVKALKEFEAQKFNPAELRKSAQKFSGQAFQAKMHDFVDSILREH